jgi:soluble lytic murein transglycosylase-like protein
MRHCFKPSIIAKPTAFLVAGLFLSVNALADSTAKKQATSSQRENVVQTIKRMAPSYGVPTWFALRIAKVESNYKPHVRGLAGEYGVYQMKCSTAREMGFRGNCSALLKPEVNIEFGLKHLTEAMRRSNGNLKLAASKHNGGLGRRKLVAQYVAKVF